MEDLARVREVVSGHHGYAREWKQRTGGKVLGYFCTYLPEEILYATGVLPVRVLGSHEPQDVTEPHLFSMFCPYSRDTLAQGLLGRYDYLDGIALGFSCPHIRQTFDSWQRHIPAQFSYFLYVPSHMQSPRALPCFEGEVKAFAQAVEGWRGIPLTNSALDKAIAVYNLNRRLLLKAYELRKPHPPLLSGATAMEIVLASKLMDKAEANPLLEGIVAQPPGDGVAGPRLMVIGSENDDVELIRFVETLGGSVVVDDNCVGTRYFWGEVSPDGDRLSAIASRYLNKPPCPQKDFVEHLRFTHIQNLAQEYGVQGILFLRQKFCDPHAYDLPPLLAWSRQQGLPSLTLELDVTVPLGQFRTRIEAFLEMLA